MSGILPSSFNDYFSWKIYESLPKSGNGTDILFFGASPIRYKVYSAWHLRPESVYPHTKRYRLMRAVCEKDINEVKTVLDEGFDVDGLNIDEKYRYKAMGLAAALNRVGIMEYFLLRGADINAKDMHGNTPLMHAVTNWQFDAIKYLVEQGADLNAKDIYGFNAIEKAKFRGLNSIADYLEQQKSKPPVPKTFPKFTVNFDFETHLSDATEQLYTKKKFYQAKPKVYPFNNLEGVYAVKFVNY